jgi:integrase
VPPRKRNKENGGLPNRWRHYHGAYYYRVPAGQEAQWDGKKQFRLGSNLSEAYRVWADRLEHVKSARTVADLLDRYALEVMPTKAAKTQREQLPGLKRLRAVFGAMTLASPSKQSLIEAHHAYTYLDKRKTKAGAPAKIAAKRELEVLSHALTKAVEWGYIRENPLLKQFTTKGKLPKVGRTRYVEKWEIDEALSLDSKRKRGSVGMVQAYIRLKLRTGLRMTDMLLLKVADLKPDGIHVRPHKTAKTTGAARIIEWDDDLLAIVEDCKVARPVDIGPYLFCNRKGEPYFNERKGTANGFESIWQRFMERVLAETKVTERFAERDLRAKSATDADSLEHAMQLLAHADTRTTKRFYRRKPERVKPSKGS